MEGLARMRFHIGDWRALLLLALAAVLAGGCAKESRDTPEACMKAFDAAMKSGDTAKAAKLFALDKWGSDNATDWSTYAPSQRDLIVGKMREEKASQLANLRASYVQGGYQATAPQTTGEWATLSLKGSAGEIPVRLYRGKAGWGIYSLGSL